jgi:hypothetical protein
MSDADAIGMVLGFVILVVIGAAVRALILAFA